ncbi:MAG: acylphosphatase [Desulfotomaculaceae bacterium]
MSNVRAHVIISGMVQGVYFRAETRDQALALGVTGWVKNKPDGIVEGLFEGEREDVEKLISWCRQGPPEAEVSDVTVSWESYRGEFPKFKITF